MAAKALISALLLSPAAVLGLPSAEETALDKRQLFSFGPKDYASQEKQKERRDNAARAAHGEGTPNVTIMPLPRRSEGKCKFLIDRTNASADSSPGMLCFGVVKRSQIRHRDVGTIVARILKEYDLGCTERDIKEVLLNDTPLEFDTKPVPAGEGPTVVVRHNQPLQITAACGAKLSCMRVTLPAEDADSEPIRCTIEANAAGDIPLIEE
ncbi:hypothetical protein ED733_001778 [Metarhizium rileyi]|uniref:Uncharacterized protein n=1 Tax=Metarhizium rileyi (strain RCEF 4871) TaxID=1649241 RepID=A0A5C6G4H0_METRR|nr:hypothetical protein ED733_001778 [Metarhizium rileyi]